MKLQEYGTKDGKQILCVPGVFMSGDFFERLAEQLPDYHFICVTLDGFHPGCDEFTGLDEQTDKLVHMLEEKGQTDFDLLIGLSMGTIFAVRLAKRPELTIRKLLLDGAVSFYRSKVPHLVGAAMYLIFRYFMRVAEDEEKSLKSLQNIYTDDWAGKSHICRKSLSLTSLKVIVKLLRDYKLEDGVKQPMYLLFGGKEQNIGVNSRVVKNLYPDARIAVKPGYNHLCYLDAKPEEYGRMVRKLTEREPADTTE